MEGLCFCRSPSQISESSASWLQFRNAAFKGLSVTWDLSAILIILSSCTTSEQGESVKLNTSLFFRLQTIQSKWKALSCDFMSLFSAVACNITRISGIETLPQVLILQIYNAQIPLGEHESSLWIQCTLRYKLAGCLFCPFCYTSESAVIQMACYAFVSLFNLWICRKSLSHWFLERCKKNKWARESLTLALMGWIQAVLGRDLLWP